MENGYSHGLYVYDGPVQPGLHVENETRREWQMWKIPYAPDASWKDRFHILDLKKPDQWGEEKVEEIYSVKVRYMGLLLGYGGTPGCFVYLFDRKLSGYQEDVSTKYLGFKTPVTSTKLYQTQGYDTNGLHSVSNLNKYDIAGRIKSIYVVVRPHKIEEEEYDPISLESINPWQDNWRFKLMKSFEHASPDRQKLVTVPKTIWIQPQPPNWDQDFWVTARLCNHEGKEKDIWYRCHMYMLRDGSLDITLGGNITTGTDVTPFWKALLYELNDAVKSLGSGFSHFYTLPSRGYRDSDTTSPLTKLRLANDEPIVEYLPGHYRWRDQGSLGDGTAIVLCQRYN